MSTSKLSVKDDFPAVQYETWRAAVEADLQGAPFEKKLVSHTYEGIDVQPVYTRQDQLTGDDPTGFPGAFPFVRGSLPFGAVLCGYDLRQEHAHPDLSVTNQAILGDLGGGVTSLLLKLDRATRQGVGLNEPAAASLAGQGGVMIYDTDDFETALAEVRLETVGVSIDSGASSLPAAASLAALWKRRGIAASRARGGWNADPLGSLAREGNLPLTPKTTMAQLADLALWTSNNYPQVTAVAVDTSVYHDAGATAAQDIAFAMATAVEYLRAMTEAGLSVDDAAKQIVFRISLGTHHFLALSKLRAARQLWARVVEACGGSGEAQAMRLHARTSNRVLTQRDPYVNLLRNSVAVFSAMTGGADAITSVPFDQASQLPNDFSRRIARNTVLILQEESHLNRIVDPAGGSWFLEKLTQQLADKGWGIFQSIEADGGMLAALQSGSIAAQIDAAYAPRAKDIAVRKEGITGVSEFPNLNEEELRRPPVDTSALVSAAAKKQQAKQSSESTKLQPLASTSDLASACFAAAADGATMQQIADALGFQAGATTIPAIEPHSFAQPFEELRDASDVFCAANGHRPRIFLANMGPVAHHTARAGYSKNFFEAGGFEVLENNGFADVDSACKAFAESGAKIAVVCSSDKLYPEFVPAVTPALKAAGARTVVLAGNPGANEAAWREAGVDRFIFIKCDVLATLRDLLREEEVLS